ncbi:hypothetical protein [Streptomyces sp. NPDC019937]|uniref:hypothetical protein n=1 Tax=Streptomyces sp. NPDC019937 TaxID=3154787 RepID=UPI0033FE876F
MTRHGGRTAVTIRAVAAAAGQALPRSGGLIDLATLITAEPDDWLVGMTALGPLARPAAPIRTERLVLRDLRRPGLFVVDLDGAMERRSAEVL